MKLEKIDLTRFRSIEKCSIFVGNVNALVGENNVGKSALLRALNSFFNLESERENFLNGTHLYTQRSQTKIKLTFNNIPNNSGLEEYLNDEKLVLELKYLPGTKRFTLNAFTPDSVSLNLDFLNQIKKYVDYVFIPPTRNEDQFKWEESKAIKRVVSALLEKKFKSRDTVSRRFVEAAGFLQRNAFDKLGSQLTEFYGDKSTFEFELTFKKNLTFLDFLTDLDFNVVENSAKNHIENCGTGVQSLSIIALYRMLASIKKSNVILGVEEPETNLHPQSQRQLVKRILSPLRTGLESQVFFTTHSTVLIDSLDHLDIILFRKQEDSSRGIKTSLKQLRKDFWDFYDIAEMQYYQFHHFRNSDFFFSRLVIIVESPTDAEVVRKLLALKNVDVSDYPVSILNLDGISNLKYPIHLIKDLDIPYILIVDKDFFVSYANGDIEDSRYSNGFPKYSYESFQNDSLIQSLIPNENDRSQLKVLLKENHSRALDLLEKYSIISMKYSLEVDLIASDIASEHFYDLLRIAGDSRNKLELLVNRYKQIKKLKNLMHVVDSVPHRNLPNSYKRIKKVLMGAMKELY